MKKKRILAGLLSAAVILTYVPCASAAASEFPDVGEKNWCYTYVTDLADKGIVTGLPDGSYGPDQNVTRGSVAKLLWEAMKHKGITISTENTSANLATGVWSAEYINALADKGILVASEYPNGSFVEGEAMSRLETIKAVVRAYLAATPAATLPASPTLTFTDTASIPAADHALVALGVELGIINGITVEGGAKFAPNDPIQRSTAAAMISRFLTVVGESHTTGKGSAQTEVPEYTPIEAPVIKTVAGETIEWVVPPTIDATFCGKFSDGFGRLVFGDYDSYGFVDTAGNVKGLYADATEFEDGLAVVFTTKFDSNTLRMGGVIDTDFNWVLGPVQCSFITVILGKYIVVTTRDASGNDHGINYTLDGKVVSDDTITAELEPTWAEALAIEATVEEKVSNAELADYGDGSGLVEFMIAEGAAFDAVDAKIPDGGIVHDRYYGFADKNGKVVVPAEYFTTDAYKNGYGTGSKRVDFHTVLTDVFDATGKIVYTYYTNPALKESDGKQINQFYAYNDGIAVMYDLKKFGYMTPTGEILIPKVFEFATVFSDGLALVKYEGKFGIIKRPVG